MTPPPPPPPPPLSHPYTLTVRPSLHEVLAWYHKSIREMRWFICHFLPIVYMQVTKPVMVPSTYMSSESLRGAQVWVRQKVVENDMSLFIELPQHLRAEVAWHWNKPVLDKIHIFKVCCKALLNVLLLVGCLFAVASSVKVQGPEKGIMHGTSTSSQACGCCYSFRTHMKPNLLFSCFVQQSR